MIDGLAKLNTTVQLLCQEFDIMIELTQKHERVLYRQNGDPRLIDRLVELEQSEEARKVVAEDAKNQAKEVRKWRFGWNTSIFLIVVDITLRLGGVF